MNDQSRVAVVGIGSNSTRLLVADKHGKSYAIVQRGEAVTKLAGYESASGGPPTLAPWAIRDTLDAATKLAEEARTSGAELVAVLGTEAVRSAANSGELVSALEKELGLPVTVLSGDEEATLGWRAVAAVGGEVGTSLGVIDVGGGSADLSVGQAGEERPRSVLSLQAGSRTMMRRFGLQRRTEPAKMIGIMASLSIELSGQVQEMQPTPQAAVVIGGTAEVIAAIYHARSGDGRRDEEPLIPRKWVAERLARLSLADQEARIAEGVPADRADIIVAGGAVLLTILDAWGLREFRISRRNILDGYLAASG